VRYVIAGDAERALGDFDPNDVGYLHAVFVAGDVKVYQVNR